MRKSIEDRYFDWSYNIVSKNRFAKSISFKKLLMELHSIEFIYIHHRDENRACDGIDLRHRYADYIRYNGNIELELSGPCSVFEMMVALSIRCEESIMGDPKYGDRTAQWFWGMINSLGLSHMQDNLFDRSEVDYIIDRFLHRDYFPNGKGGLFTIRNCDRDLREVEIWYQLCWYLNTFID